MKSMTGFGRGAASRDGVSLLVEITAVNHKRRDLRIRLPEELGDCEPQLWNLLSGAIERGSVTAAVTLDLGPELRAAQYTIDAEAAGAVIHSLRAIARRHGLGEDLRLADLLAVPGVVSTNRNLVPPETAAALVAEATAAALDDLNRARDIEGAALRDDLHARCRRLRDLLHNMEARKDGALRHHRDRLRERIRQLGVELPLDDERLVKEVAFAAQKSDVNEELVRLDSHLDQLDRHLDNSQGQPVGLHLQFLCQELQREIGTLGAKTAETDIAAATLEFKAELERLREQAANVE